MGNKINIQHVKKNVKQYYHATVKQHNEYNLTSPKLTVDQLCNTILARSQLHVHVCYDPA